MAPFLFLCFVSAMLSCLFITALWSPAGKGLTSWFSCVSCFLCMCCPGSGVVLDYIDCQTLPTSLL